MPGVLLLIFAAEILFVTHGGYLYGSTTDWPMQHVELPSYMRQLFYSTGKLFPDFAMNLGGGQNIYYIAYYGLFSPIVLFSYLLPMVPMLPYMMVASIVMTALSILLIWRWLNQHVSRWPAFAGALMFTLAAPVMYHSHHHLMFVNYLPFMILAMEGLEKYVRERKCLQLVLSVFLIVLCSYFFSVGAVLCLCVYGICLYLERKDGGKGLRDFTGKALRFIGVLIIPVLMSAVLWLPVLHVMLAGRADTTVSLSLQQLFVPQFQVKSFFYGNSGMGLTAVFLLCIAGCLAGKSKGKRFAAVIFLLLMFFGLPVYIMNGGMYINGKVLIPFLPFAALLFGSFLEDTAGRKYSLRAFLICAGILAAAAFLTWHGSSGKRALFLPDLCISLVLILLLYIQPEVKKKPFSAAERNGLTALLLIPALLTCFTVNSADTLMAAGSNPRTLYGTDASRLLKQAETSMEESGTLSRTDLFYDRDKTVNYVLDPEQLRSSMYSSLNSQRYHNYYYKESGNEISGRSNALMRPVRNPLFALRMGVRYIIGYNNDVPVAGFRRTAVSGGLALYENPDALPLGYTSVSGAFTPEATALSGSSIEAGLLSLDGVSRSSDPLRTDVAALKNGKSGGTLSFHLKKEETTKIDIDPSPEDRILEITMDVKNRSGRKGSYRDVTKNTVAISVNNVKNVLAPSYYQYGSGNDVFHYTLLVKAGTDHLTLRAGHGKYTVSNIRVAAWPYEQYTQWRKTLSSWQVRRESDNILTGKITAAKDGDMYISIPYDDGFTVTVDGKQGSCRETSDGFLSVPLKKGTHTVTLIFRAPLKREGMALSAAGILLLVLAETLLRRKRRKPTEMPEAAPEE